METGWEHDSLKIAAEVVGGEVDDRIWGHSRLLKLNGAAGSVVVTQNSKLTDRWTTPHAFFGSWESDSLSMVKGLHINFLSMHGCTRQQHVNFALRPSCFPSPSLVHF